MSPFEFWKKGVYVVHAGNQIHPNSNMAQLIPFSDLTGGTDSVRFTVINGGTYMSVRDIIMVVCNKNKDQAGRAWRDLDDRHKEEVRPFFLSNFQFPCQRERVQQVITLEGTLKLIMWLSWRHGQGLPLEGVLHPDALPGRQIDTGAGD